MDVRKGDRYKWNILDVEVTRVSKQGEWADIHVTSKSMEWTKRQRLPFPATFQKVPA